MCFIHLLDCPLNLLLLGCVCKWVLVLRRFPFYYHAKFAFLIWLQLPRNYVCSTLLKYIHQGFRPFYIFSTISYFSYDLKLPLFAFWASSFWFQVPYLWHIFQWILYIFEAFLQWICWFHTLCASFAMCPPLALFALSFMLDYLTLYSLIGKCLLHAFS